MIVSAQAIQAALAEVQQKTEAQIETETAAKWAARALAAWQLAQIQGPNSLAWFVRAVTYKHEALEHAVCAVPGLLHALQQQLMVVP